MNSIFPEIHDEDDAPKSFPELWNSLGRDKKKYEYLRVHQLKILEEVYINMQESDVKDIAISLPTGTGKTAVALLLAFYFMRREKIKVLYLCPNIFLCNQVLKEADRLGIPAVTLYGKWINIPKDQKTNFISGDSVGVATYNTLFNSNPQVGKLDLIIMDDIHAAGDAIISNWSIKIKRDNNDALFEKVDEILKPILNRSQKNAIETKPHKNEEYEMLYSRQWLKLVDDVKYILEDHSDDEGIKNQWKTLKSKLENCICLLNYNSIEIRPLTPPSHTLSQFNGAKHRVYMSATPDFTGNLENNIGIEKLKWISLKDVDVPGNRFILNLDSLIPKETDENKVISIVKKLNKMVILSPSIIQQTILKDALEGVGYKGAIFSPKSDSISEDMEKFKKETIATILLAGRYDGIDLGDGIANGIILYHLPQAINAFENFTTLKWEIKDEAEARAIQRVHQGMGRCTRRDSDEVLIFLVGDDLVKLILNPQTISFFPGKLRLELGMCKNINDPNALDSLLSAFREKKKDWIEARDEINRKAAKLTSDVDNSNPTKPKFLFIKYSNFLWSGNYDAAISLANDMINNLKSNGGGRDSAIWAYLGGFASDISAFVSGKNPYLEPGNALFHEAVSRSKNREWFGYLSNLLEPERIKPELESKIERINSFLTKIPVHDNTFKEYSEDLITKLRSGEDKNVKLFLQTLGESLGFDTLVPSRQGSPDCIWKYRSTVAFLFEAKTQKTNDSLSISEVRQIISLTEEVKNNENLDVPANLLPICITDVSRIAKEEFHSATKFYILKTKELELLASRWFRRLLSVNNFASKNSDLLKWKIQYELVGQEMIDQGLRNKLCGKLGSDVLQVK